MTPYKNGIWYDEGDNEEDLENPPVDPNDPEEPNDPTPPDYGDDDPWGDDEPPEVDTPKPITQSILLTVKKMLGIAEEYHAFDLDVITNINATFFTLNQLGVGPEYPYTISGEEELWEDFLEAQHPLMTSVQTYTYMRVRLMFDPPTNSFLVDSFRKQCDEFEWRFTVQPKIKMEVEKPEEPEEEKPDEGGEMASRRRARSSRRLTPMDIFG